MTTVPSNPDKRWRVNRDGYNVGEVMAPTRVQAEQMAQDEYGPTATVDGTIRPGDTVQTLEEEINARGLATAPRYRTTEVPIEGFSDWLLKNPGIVVVQFTPLPHVPRPTKFVVLYYRLMQLPIRVLLDEIEPTTREQLEKQFDFFERLHTDLQSNEALFQYAQELGVVWIRRETDERDRISCINEIRRQWNLIGRSPKTT
jgi:hypothetical protein